MKKNIWTLIIGMILAASLILNGCGAKKEEPPAASASAASEEEATSEATSEAEAASVSEAEAEPEAEEEENTLAGSYYAVYDATEAMEEAIGEMGGGLSAPIEMVFLMDLNEDETFRFALDSDSFIKSVTTALEGSVDGIIASAMGMDELDEETAKLLAEQSGFTTYEEFRQSMLEVMSGEMQNQGLEELKMEGTYTADGNKISFTSDDDSDMSDVTIEADGTLSMSMENDTVNGTLVFEKGTYVPKETTTEESTESTESAEKSESEAQESKDTSAEAIAFEPMTVVDNEECSITFTGIDPDNTWGYSINALLENKSADKTYMFSVETATVNGVVNDPFFATQVAPGKKANDTISFSKMDEYGIDDFTDIQIFYRVYDADDWSADNIIQDSVHVYPHGEDKATRFVREPQTTDHVLVDDDNVTVIVTGAEMDSIWGYTLKLYLENKTDSEVMFSVDNASVNGFMADPFYASSVKAGSCAFSTMSWSDSTLEENGIENVEEIEFTLRAYNAEDWTGDDLVKQVCVFNPSAGVA